MKNNSKEWAHKATEEFKKRNGGKLGPQDATKVDMEAVIELSVIEIDRLKKKIHGLQKLARCQRKILDGAKSAAWIDRHIDNLMEPEL